MSKSDVLAAEQRFFSALLAADRNELESVLTDDFMMIDVLTGSEVERSTLVEVVGSGKLHFEKIEPVPPRVRLHERTAIVTGRTDMEGRFGEAPFAARSRYTHVFVEQQGRWRLASAQGTPIHD